MMCGLVCLQSARCFCVPWLACYGVLGAHDSSWAVACACAHGHLWLCACGAQWCILLLYSRGKWYDVWSGVSAACETLLRASVCVLRCVGCAWQLMGGCMWCLRARSIDPGELDDDHAPADLWSGPLSVKLGSGLRRVMHVMRSRQRACMWLHTGHRGGACPISVFPQFFFKTRIFIISKRLRCCVLYPGFRLVRCI